MDAASFCGSAQKEKVRRPFLRRGLPLMRRVPGWSGLRGEDTFPEAAFPVQACFSIPWHISRQGACPSSKSGNPFTASFFLSADILSPLLRKEGPETVPSMMEYGTCPSFPRKNGELAFHAGGFSPERLLFPEWRGRPFPTFFSLPAKGGGFCPCQNECRHYT